ncbi:hypothetical protein RAS1_20670 [Phycisphaerae bacterium RAS1]|nr:hypothetical protein RAS1_20670 [Phycisphaerae bacterium RAS1]
MATDWQMPRAAQTCGACGRSFQPGERFRACLFEQDAGYVRCDYCETCLPQGILPPIGSWCAHVAEEGAKKAPAFDREAIYNFFCRLEDAEEPDKRQFRFVLALLLWRKKALKFERTTDAADGEAWEFSSDAGAARHRVPRPPIDEAQIEQLSRQLESLLAGGGEIDSRASANIPAPNAS